jgi:hypothetical protein
MAMPSSGALMEERWQKVSCQNFNVKISSAWYENVVKEGGRVHLVRGGANPAWNQSSSTLVSQLHELEQNYKHEF